MAHLKFKETHALNATYNSDNYHSPKNTNTHLKTSAELVKRMISCDPDKEKLLLDIEDKPRILLTYDELQTEGKLLREKLKTVNKNLDRIVKKQIISNQVEQDRKH